jgi:hypothetical protein
MTNRLGNPLQGPRGESLESEGFGPAARRLACSGCGTEFSCDLSGQCWCAAEAAVLPMPVAGEDCLCRDCLRKAAADAD